MGCGTSIYPDVQTKTSAPTTCGNPKTDSVKEKNSPLSINPLHQNHSQTNDLTRMQSMSQKDTMKLDSRAPRNGILCNTDSRLNSPAYSDRTDVSKRVKRVGFKDESEMSGAREDRFRHPSNDLQDRKSARRRRDRKLRIRLLSKLSDAESISARLLLEGDRLSLTSSVSRTTSRTGSPFPVPPIYKPNSPVTASSVASYTSS